MYVKTPANVTENSFADFFTVLSVLFVEKGFFSVFSDPVLFGAVVVE
jgi:hypothetical protein